jgi:hypothetical protein
MTDEAISEAEKWYRDPATISQVERLRENLPESKWTYEECSKLRKNQASTIIAVSDLSKDIAYKLLNLIMLKIKKGN